MRFPPSRQRNSQQHRARIAFLLRMAILASVIVAWDLVVRIGVVEAQFLSPPLDVARAMVDLVGDPVAQAAFGRTGHSIVLAFAIGTSAGLLVGLCIGASRLLREAFYPPITFLLSTPNSIFLPIFTLIFGLGVMSAAAFGAFQSFFYVVVNVVGGLGLVEKRHLQVARAYGASAHHRYRDVIVPAAMPGIFAAFWYGIKHAFLGVLIAQLWASDGGIGPLIRTYSSAMRTDYVLAIVLVITILAVVAGTLWTRLETRMTRWRSSGVGAVTATL